MDDGDGERYFFCDGEVVVVVGIARGCVSKSTHFFFFFSGYDNFAH